MGQVGGKMSSLGGKEGLDRRWAGHDALTKIESVGNPQELALFLLRNSDPAPKPISLSYLHAF